LAAVGGLKTALKTAVTIMAGSNGHISAAPKLFYAKFINSGSSWFYAVNVEGSIARALFRVGVKKNATERKIGREFD
jgi:hypothetical protein